MLIGASITQGAICPSHVRRATKVCFPQCPHGGLLLCRPPLIDWPRRWVILVVVPVSLGEGQPVALLAYDGLASIPAFHPLHGQFREDAVTSRSFAVLSSVTSSGMVNHLRRP